jgi:pimeloyl-ACP methyl ester carboxylesterase
MGQLGAGTDFADPEGAERLLELHKAELAIVNAEVNRTLGEDFQSMFASPAVRHRLSELDVPVLLVHGESDPRPKAAVEALATELPRSRLVILDRVGHFPYWEAPETLRDLLRDFLGALSSDGRRRDSPPSVKQRHGKECHEGGPPQ